MRASSVAIALLLVACDGPKDDPKKQPPPVKVAENHKIDGVRMKLPEGWTSDYNVNYDKWLFTPESHSPAVTLDRTPPGTTAAPEALRHYLETTSWAKGTTAEIEKREALSDGFAATLLVTVPGEGERPRRDLYVIKELGSEWFRCFAIGVDDDAMRDQVLALCKSIKR